MKEYRRILQRIVMMLSLLLCVGAFYSVRVVYADEVTTETANEVVLAEENTQASADVTDEKEQIIAEEALINSSDATIIEDLIVVDDATLLGEDENESSDSDKEMVSEDADSQTSSEEDGEASQDEDKKEETDSSEDPTVNPEETEEQKAVYATIYKGIDYSLVYDYNYYIKNQDVKDAFGDDDVATLENFVRWGMASQRQGIATFDVVSYRRAYADLRAAYGTDYPSYYLHYIKWGYAGGRTMTTGVEDVIGATTVQDGVDYSLVYDYYYFSQNQDVKDAFGDDDVATLANFIRWGMTSQRQGIESFDVVSYRRAYVDLRIAFGDDYPAYYLHYMKYGYYDGHSITTGVEELQNPVTVQDGLDYSLIYDYYYFSANEDVKAAFGENDVATLANFIRWGLPAGRLGNESFDVSFYADKYKSTLGDLYGSNMNAYAKHYILWGHAAGLIANRAEDTKFAASSNGESIVSYSNLDANGNVIYYMFLMNDMSLEDVTLSVSLITPVSASAGSLDQETNSITGISIGNGESMTITDSDGKTYILNFMQSSLRSVSITLSGTDLQTIAAGSKDVKYEGNTISFIDNDLTKVSYSNTEVKGRGDSTWQYKDKLPFQIKLNKKQSVFGMDKAKKWVLLANAYDDTLSRNAIAYTIAQELGVAGAVDFEYCNLWIDGEFQGNYIICEKAEIGSGRLELENDEGAMFEPDNLLYWSEDYFTETDMGFVTVKELVNDDDEEAMSLKVLENFKTTIHGLFTYLATMSEPTLAGLGQYIDVESFAQYYLISEYFMCWEAMDISAYFYQDGPDDVIHFGPVWDFDTSMGNMKWNVSAYDHYEGTNSIVLSALMDTKCFRDYLLKYYNEHKEIFTSATTINTDTYMMLLTTNAANMNFTKDRIFGQSSLKSNVEDYATSWWEAYHQVDVWLTNRAKIYNPVNGIDAFMDVKRDGTNLIIRTNYSAMVSVSIWLTEDKGTNITTLTRAQGRRQADGSYIFTYSLANIREAGRITIHMDVNDGATNLPEKFYYCRLKPYISGGYDYSPVFNAQYYWDTHTALQSVYSRSDSAALFAHFLRWGIAAGWQGSGEFNVTVYRKNYPELTNIYGSNMLQYYLHYIRWGRDSHLTAV